MNKEISKLEEENEKLKQRIKLLEFDLIHDELTKLKTRKYLIDRSKVYLKSLFPLRDNHRKLDDENKREHIGFLFCDIDFFKQYNDTYGHQKGDECIEIVGSIIKKVCKRPIDIPVRYGGEEFVLILPQTNLEGALKISLEIQSELISHEIDHIGSSVGKNLSISIGISSLIPDKGHDYSEIIGLADAALYRAKANGRNRIES